MNRVAILSNAGSGRNHRRDVLLRDLDTLSGVHHRVTRSAEEVDAALAELLAPAPDVLAVNGGDGTVQAVLTALERRGGSDGPPLAILPAGSTNMSAHDLRCGGPLHARLVDLLALRDRPVAAWRLAERRPLNISDHAGDIRVGFFFGLGTIVRGIWGPASPWSGPPGASPGASRRSRNPSVSAWASTAANRCPGN